MTNERRVKRDWLELAFKITISGMFIIIAFMGYCVLNIAWIQATGHDVWGH